MAWVRQSIAAFVASSTTEASWLQKRVAVSSRHRCVGDELDETTTLADRATRTRASIVSVTFGPVGPFDAHEQRVVRDVASALAKGTPETAQAIESVQMSVTRLESLTEAVIAFPPELPPGTLGARDGGLGSLLDVLSHADLASFELCLPTRGLLSRDLVMAEVNFYRLLRSIVRSCELPAALLDDVDACLCRSLHSRLALEVLTHIASDDRLPEETRAEAARALWRLWDDTTYRLSEFFPALVATWEARRQVPVVLGTLMGATELYQLIGAGCDPGFVDWLVREDQPEEQAEAFREFLFGTTTEELQRLEERMTSDGRATISRDELTDDEQPRDACGPGDPAIALFDFFLTRHLQAAARRRMGLAGPTRTAEEYVMLHFLEERRAGRS